MEVTVAKKLRHLKEENRKLTKVVAGPTLGNRALKNVLGRKLVSSQAGERRHSI